MLLLSKELSDQLPNLYEQDGMGDNATIFIKYFMPDSNWTWYVMEGQKQNDGDFLFFGLVDGLEKEYGYFLLSELKSVRGRLNLRVERDLHFIPTKLGDIKTKYIYFDTVD